MPLLRSIPPRSLSPQVSESLLNCPPEPTVGALPESAPGLILKSTELRALACSVPRNPDSQLHQPLPQQQIQYDLQKVATTTAV